MCKASYVCFKPVVNRGGRAGGYKELDEEEIEETRRRRREAEDDGEMYDEFGNLKKKFRAKTQQAEAARVLPGSGRAGWEVEELGIRFNTLTITSYEDALFLDTDCHTENERYRVLGWTLDTFSIVPGGSFVSDSAESSIVHGFAFSGILLDAYGMEEKEAETEEGNGMIEKVARIESVKIGKDAVVEAERGIGERIGAVIMIMSEIEIMDGIETEADTFTEKERMGDVNVVRIWQLIETF
ncbi:hypothetical protein Gogos_018216 [Gossypium gossypioides]|uniref:Uncharacterized protein n=1 Tax=Gossypium gossypioides TaxID=34282 RepID=A0A7J9BDE0_GOSGO|nr:hypothetical protein [Gossypium gossypioides]